VLDGAGDRVEDEMMTKNQTASAHSPPGSSPGTAPRAVNLQNKMILLILKIRVNIDRYKINAIFRK
jgi:hypothetical protein